MEGGSSSLDLPNSAVMASMMATTSTRSEELGSITQHDV